MIDSVKAGLLDWMIEIRRDLHQHPELGWQEVRTAARIESALEDLGLEPRRVRGTGVVADLAGPDGLPMVALRADIDALPIQEETGLPYTSVNDGVMHACGHDAHAGMVLGAAALLVEDDNLPI